MYCYNYKPYLMHYGVKGMKWGVRRYQNYDGTKIGSSKRSTNVSPAERAKIAKRYITFDTDARRKENALHKKQMAEKSAIKPPKTFWGPDGRLSKEGREHLDKMNKIDAKYDKQYRRLWDEHNKERKEQSKAIFLNSDVEPNVKAAKQALEKINSSYDDHLGVHSANYQKAFKEYKAKHKNELDPDDIAYGFDHYEWSSGHAAYDAAYKEYNKSTKALQKEYEEQTVTIGNKILADQFDTYKDATMVEVDQFVRFRYDEFGRR